MKSHSRTLVSLVAITLLAVTSGCSGGSSPRATNAEDTPQAAPLQQGITYLKRHMAMVNASDACDRSNAWFIQNVYEQINEGGGASGDESGYAASATPGMSSDEDAIELPISGEGWPATVHLAFNKPTQPWTVVVRRDMVKKQIVADGYGDSIEKPLLTETLK
jgi:hypothetical protein